jgi:serpin B
MVRVDEEGTEAAAATAVNMQATSAMVDPPLTLVIDRPFIFLIRDDATGALLFMGRIVNPKAG